MVLVLNLIKFRTFVWFVKVLLLIMYTLIGNAYRSSCSMKGTYLASLLRSVNVNVELIFNVRCKTYLRTKGYFLSEVGW